MKRGYKYHGFFVVACGSHSSAIFEAEGPYSMDLWCSQDGELLEESVEFLGKDTEVVPDAFLRESLRNEFRPEEKE